MKYSQERMTLIYKGRLIMSLGLCAWMLILSLMINRGVFFYVLAISLFICVFTQPLFWPRFFQPTSVLPLRLTLYIDLLVLNIFFYFFGGVRSGPLLAVVLLTILYGSVVIRPREGIYAALVGVALFIMMVFLVEKGLLPPQVGLIQEPMRGFWPWTALILTTAVLLLLPAHIGYLIYKAILEREADVQAAMERFSRLFSEVWEPVLVMGQDQRILRANPAAAVLFACPEERLLGKKLTEVISGESVDDFAVLVHDVETTGHVRLKNLRLSLPGGEERMVELSASPYVLDAETSGIFLLFQDMTEQRRLEEELKRYTEELYRRVEERTVELEESRESYFSLFEKAAAPLCWLDPYGLLLSANRAFYALTGLDKSVEGKVHLVDLLFQEADRRQVAHYLDQMRRGYDAPSRLELMVQKPDQGVLWTEWFIRFEPLTDQLLVSIFDITERKRAEEALRESEERYRTLVETSPDSIVVTDLSAKVLMANQQAARMYGAASPQEMIGKSAFDFIVPEDREAASKSLLETLEKGAVHNVEYRLFRTDGSSYPAETSAALLRDQEGEPKWLIGITRDISRRRQLETALRESEERYRTLFEESRDVIYIVERDGRIIDINPSAVELFGYTREELLRMNILELYPEPRDREAYQREIEEKGFVRDYELMLKRKDGALIDCLVTSTVRRAPDGTILGYQGILRDITERKRAEQALRESEEKYRLLIETSPDAIILTDLKMNRLMVTPQAAKLLGFESIEQLPGRNAMEYIAPEDRERVLKDIATLLQTGQIRNHEYTLIRNDGSRIFAEANVTLVRDAEGKPQALLSVIRDITERKQAEKALRDSEERYRLLIETSPDAIILTDLKINYTIINQRTVQMLGFASAQEVEGISALQFVLPEELPQVQADIQTLLETGHLYNRQYHLRRRDGSIIPLELNATLIRNEAGEPQAFMAVVRDITERQQAEAALKKSEEQYRFMAENVSDIIWIMDMNLRYTYISPVAARYRGYSVEEIYEQTVEEVLTPPSLELAMKVLQEQLEIEKRPDKDPSRSITLELEQTHKNGSTVWGEVRMTFLRDAEGNPIGILGVTRDITERKEMERKQAQLQAQLLEAEKMAMAGQVAAGVAHEMNNPLTAISYYAQTLEKTLAHEPTEIMKVKRIQEAADRIQQLLGRLLNYTALTEAKLEPLDLNAVVKEVLDAIPHEFEKRPKAKLVLRLEPQLPHIQASRELLFHLISNLAVNALQSLPQDKGKVTIATEKKEASVVLEVKDNGIGIQAEDLPRIFTPFFTRRPGGQGTGLGLAIVQQVAHLHHAQIEVDSTPHKGTTFRVSFPFLPAGETAPLAPDSALA